MSRVYGKYGPMFPTFGRIYKAIAQPFLRGLFRTRGFHGPTSKYANDRANSMREKLEKGECVFLLGITPSAYHDSGASLVKVTNQDISILCSEEEERYSGIKHFGGYPELSIEAIKKKLNEFNLSTNDIHACIASVDYPGVVEQASRQSVENIYFPQTLTPNAIPLHDKQGTPQNIFWNLLKSPKKLSEQLGIKSPIIMMPHHDNHAHFSFGVSPFNADIDPVMISVIDAAGDTGAISLYVAQNGHVELFQRNDNIADSLGFFYCMISSTQGGWTPLSSEGRWMGASAWGNNDRLTNPYYKRLRQIFYFGEDGQIFHNRLMGNWPQMFRKPYTKDLEAVVGEAIEDYWNPDKILRVEDVEHAQITRNRVDKAAATQLVFEDALFHIVENMIRKTGSDKLVLAGGTALNCIANMRLLEHFDIGYYQRYFGKNTRLHIWVPPTPGDQGVAIGAAYSFAMKSGVKPKERMSHAFYCGFEPQTQEILDALKEVPDIQYLNIEGNAADFAAFVVANDGVLGLYHGKSEIGPRALGHRTIVANPTNPRALEQINLYVKSREPIRPLAPMMTLEEAMRFFDLQPGASDDNFNAYNYMVQTVRAKPEAREKIPAVIHQDGTARIQIVRQEDNFTYSYLKNLGKRIGIEVSVNTSLNVGSPIVQSPAQAIEALRRSKGLSGLIMIAQTGESYLAWHNSNKAPKDEGKQIQFWFEQWKNLVK